MNRKEAEERQKWAMRNRTIQEILDIMLKEFYEIKLLGLLIDIEFDSEKFEKWVQTSEGKSAINWLNQKYRDKIQNLIYDI